VSGDHRRKIADSLKEREAVEPLTDAVQAVHGEARIFVTLVGKFIRYGDFFKQENGEILSVGDFKSLVAAGIFDIFGSDLTDDQKAGKLRIDVPRLEELRRHTAMPRLRERLVEIAEDLALPRTFEMLAEKCEELLARDALTLALLAPDPKVRQSANKEFIDRRSAKRGRPGKQTVLIMPANLVQEIEAGARILGLLGRDSSIDAGVLNVPKLIGSGSTEE
jgi:ribosomal protein S30